MWLLLSLVRDSCSLCYLYVAETGLKLITLLLPLKC